MKEGLSTDMAVLKLQRIPISRRMIISCNQFNIWADEKCKKLSRTNFRNLGPRLSRGLFELHWYRLQRHLGSKRKWTSIIEVCRLITCRHNADALFSSNHDPERTFYYRKSFSVPFPWNNQRNFPGGYVLRGTFLQLTESRLSSSNARDCSALHCLHDLPFINKQWT